ncbi:PH domain-containing protein [Brachybacterium sp. AOP42-C2-15]|uniref:PH domain-containing protein n=1 Tax=unclassified Brachybacterium TaxID=2623841 RepID=UPI004033E77C
MGKRLDRYREAAELQRSVREAHGQDADAVMAQAYAESASSGRAERTYREAMARNRGLRFRAADGNLPQQVLHPDETVHDVAVGALRSDTFPLLIVTDRRILHVMDRFRGWTILEEAPAAEIVGAEIEKRLLSGRFRVQVRHGKDITMKISEWTRSQEVLGLVQRLAAGGAPPR